MLKSVSDNINDEIFPEEVFKPQRTGLELTSSTNEAECLSTLSSDKSSTSYQPNLSPPETPVASVISQSILNNTGEPFGTSNAG